jgi:hypothetical protein
MAPNVLCLMGQPKWAQTLHLHHFNMSANIGGASDVIIPYRCETGLEKNKDLTNDDYQHPLLHFFDS